MCQGCRHHDVCLSVRLSVCLSVCLSLSLPLSLSLSLSLSLCIKFIFQNVLPGGYIILDPPIALCPCNLHYICNHFAFMCVFPCVNSLLVCLLYLTKFIFVINFCYKYLSTSSWGGHQEIQESPWGVQERKKAECGILKGRCRPKHRHRQCPDLWAGCCGP